MDTSDVPEPGAGRPATETQPPLTGADAGFLAVGRYTDRSRAGPARLGRIAHAVLHHCPAPVAVVPHD
ncbi:hypothetical protein [Streptomyces gilvosporeus]|uniref:UspA domain-containing protein n=1 Tax=Streptomyces gilvosporeus TaxID=553510 RepID=A0A1V0TK87_9ACTN|nr:hypothetical protein B1H19_03520 [Streptomyces gilvosporeus]